VTEAADVCVIGAGFVGSALAAELCRRGRSVVLIDVPEQADIPAALAPVGLSRPYAAVVQELGREGAREVWEVHRENHQRLREWLSDRGSAADAVDYRPRGTFVVGLDRAAARALADSEDVLRDDGFTGEFLDHYMLEARFDVRGFAGAYWATDGGSVDHAALRSLAAASAMSAGARRHAARVEGVERRPPGVVVQTNVGPIAAEAVVMATDSATAVVTSFLSPRVRRIRRHGVALAIDSSHELPHPGALSGGATQWHRPNVHRLSISGEEDAETLGALARGYFPGVHAVLETSSREALATLDGFPLIGDTPDPFWVALGLSGADEARYGLLAARWLADAITTGRDPTPALYRASRGLSLA
jgi:glycine/D-amino acid oxidase-like deaminating enzyme